MMEDAVDPATASLPRLPPQDPARLRLLLRRSTRECMDRGLAFAGKWSAELLRHIPPAPKGEDATGRGRKKGVVMEGVGQGPAFRTSTPVRLGTNSGTARQSLPNLPAITSIHHTRGAGGAHPRDSLGSVMEVEPSSPILGTDPLEEGEGEGAEDALDGEAQDEEEQDIYLLGLAFFRSHEHLRATFALKDCTGPRARWLRTYAKFLAGEKRSQEEAGDLMGVKDRGAPNPFTQELLDEMATWEPGFVERDGWLLFLKALLLLSLPPTAPAPLPRDQMQSGNPGATDIRIQVLDILVASVKLEPYNWSAWLKIAGCLDGSEELETVMRYLPREFPCSFFYVHATLEIHAAGEGLHEVLDELEGIFPNCAAIKGMRGLVHYHVREFEEATKYFNELQISDPYRVEDIDIFSNILYVTEKRAELAMLAQEYTKLDRSRPEVCCLIGNYYSLRREHEKAILYFRRALKLDRSYLSAWTLMGHEYIEIKNTNAAIASYRQAVDVNRKDYRAWYGLGQTYELLGEPFYALNYYQKATALRPYDARMWTALAVCYEKLKRLPDAVKAYQRALVASEPGENDTAIRIGRIYSLLGDSVKAAHYHRRALNEALKVEAPRTEISKIQLWLAKHEIVREKEGGEGDLAVAEEYLKEAMLVQEDKEEANGYLKEVQTLLLSRD